MRYVCGDCGCKFNEEEAGTHKELVGEFWGAPAYQEFMNCPECSSDYIEEYDGEESEDEEC